jgi:hypothetical protein
MPQEGSIYQESLPNAPMLKASEVASFLRIPNRSTFWETVRRYGIPHTKITRRKILFPRAKFIAWLEKRSCFDTRRYPMPEAV